MARIAKGSENLIQHAEHLLTEGRLQPALEVSGYALQLMPGHAKVKDFRVAVLMELPEQEQDNR